MLGAVFHVVWFRVCFRLYCGVSVVYIDLFLLSYYRCFIVLLVLLG